MTREDEIDNKLAVIVERQNDLAMRIAGVESQLRSVRRPVSVEDAILLAAVRSAIETLSRSIDDISRRGANAPAISN